MNKLSGKSNIADWNKDKAILQAIRREVFINEQSVPEDLEWDGLDESSIHFVYQDNNQAIATARLKPDGQIGRMAVLLPYRNKGVGSDLIQFIIKTAEIKQYQTIYLNAQVYVIDFYKKFGFTTEGERFDDANIPHQKMTKPLDT